MYDIYYHNRYKLLSLLILCQLNVKSGNRKVRNSHLINHRCRVVRFIMIIIIITAQQKCLNATVVFIFAMDRNERKKSGYEKQFPFLLFLVFLYQYNNEFIDVRFFSKHLIFSAVRIVHRCRSQWKIKSSIITAFSFFDYRRFFSLNSCAWQFFQPDFETKSPRSNRSAQQ